VAFLMGCSARYGTIALQADINGMVRLINKGGNSMNEKTGSVGVYHKTEIWIDDVMNYFGEFVNEEQAKKLWQESKGNGYFETMHNIRSKLLDMGYSVPFRAIYRRTKDE